MENAVEAPDEEGRMTWSEEVASTVQAGVHRLVVWVGIMAACGLAQPLLGQGAESGRPGRRPVIDRDREIALALSAAPAAVTDAATVLAWNGSTFEIARAGANGVTCYVSRSWPESLEPHCFDEEGSATVLPIHLREVELWNEGKTRAEIDAVVAEGLRSGAFRLPSRPVMSYMMSAGQELIGDDGSPVGAWRPHLMIYYPYLTSDALGLGPVPSTEAAVVVDPGTPLSNLMIVVSDFVPVRGTERDESSGPC
jgi:hypothetical protein